MSRIGRKPIVVPAGVTITQEGHVLTVKGPKGTLSRALHEDMIVRIETDEIHVERPSDAKLHRSLHGTTRSVVSNMVEGVTKGYEKVLDLVGVGYRATKAGNKVTLTLGFSHPVEVVAEEGLEIDVPTNTRLIVKGIDKERVGTFSAKIRDLRRPEPYKGKGIRYENEVVRRKVGKTGKK
ncbi:50S ribosomal protein L6 [Ferroacidibacillus organovorans]|uniref:Large ribosomal subunit protein uL6 n=1 Tax=Ferroacidibacillus organovorans TaxID=1765683 RepID=A0A162SBL9_9BACL|nr:50S ribosomal protein L6 [Ferroacidibacillus organovorans]KYP79683.1 50S ribosomal protein L6 [Ferroacidibacillus organovorans]OAG94815.1 50S ribosomal protein L6 [Ferroacidibacillus organovorans]OPG14872.1 50S ribosomal protein L6 [Ferroacidibacillus organovorans]